MKACASLHGILIYYGNLLEPHLPLGLEKALLTQSLDMRLLDIKKSYFFSHLVKVSVCKLGTFEGRV